MDAFAKIIAEDVLVFAYCGEDQMDEEFSVTQLERVALELRLAGDKAIASFIRTVADMEQEARAQGLSERAEQLASMPIHLGLQS